MSWVRSPSPAPALFQRLSSHFRSPVKEAIFACGHIMVTSAVGTEMLRASMREAVKFQIARTAHFTVLQWVTSKVLEFVPHECELILEPVWVEGSDPRCDAGLTVNA